MKSYKSISVIVPVFNAARTLEASLRSLLDQSLDDIEIIVVDDASTDNSNEIIKRLSVESKNIVAIHFPENKGVHEARLAGIERASAQWIGFLDADDFARPEMYELMLSAAKEQNVDIVVCGSYITDTQGKIIRKRTFFRNSERIEKDIFERFCRFEFGDGALWNKLYKSHLLKDLVLKCFPWRQNINEDLIANIGAFHKATSLYLMKNMLHEYVAHSNSATAKQDNATAYIDTLRAYAVALRSYQGFDANSVFNVTSLYRRQLDYTSCRVDNLKYLGIIHASHLIEATKLIQEIYPQGLGLICSRSKDISQLPIKYLARNLAKRIVSRFRISL